MSGQEVAAGFIITNILISGDGMLYIGNFGLSMILARRETDILPPFAASKITFERIRDYLHAGNIRWMAPEALMGIIKPTKACDVWSYSCIMMQVFSGRQPYHNVQNAIAVFWSKTRGVELFSQLTKTSRWSHDSEDAGQLPQFDSEIGSAVKEIRDMFHPSILLAVARQEYQNQPNPEMCIRMAASQFCSSSKIDEMHLSLVTVPVGR
ncbi:kinase-like domain-containing protein [Suillus bovinus]|uniref:kinase-like domain-containing protein n=1 Tax=Suillus bovinus TaxID=48563 RepID=UPI001B86312F|nr:kinase-like domain-containing protein [Suillus bovinus]KAG2151172.1 kinase-like domain-containing protein [Suillus bovinus]